MIPQIKLYLLDNWRKYFAVRPDNIQILLLSNPQGKRITHGKVTNLIFINHNKVPTLVCKFMRTYEGEVEKLTGENLLLNALKDWKVAPEPFEQTVINGKIVTFEKYIPGSSIKTRIQKKVNLLGMTDIQPLLEDIKLDFDKTAILLSELTNFKLNNISKNYSYVDKAICDVDQLVNRMNLSEENKNLILKICKNYNFIENHKVLVHFDLTPSNIIENLEGLKIIDFEFSKISKHIFIDAYRFMFYYFHNLHELNVLPYKEYNANFWHFFVENTNTFRFTRNFITAVIGELDETLFLEYMSLFLISNLQLQIDESDVLAEHFLYEISSLISLCLKLIKGETINAIEYGSIDPYSEMSREELVVELNLRQKNLDDYAAALNIKERELEKNNQYITRCHKTIENKDIELGNANLYISQCHEVIEKKDRELSQNVTYIQSCHDTISNKDNEIITLNKSLEQEVEKRRGGLLEFNLLEEKLGETQKLYNETISELKKEIELLKEELNNGFFSKIRRKIGKGEN